MYVINFFSYLTIKFKYIQGTEQPRELSSAAVEAGGNRAAVETGGNRAAVEAGGNQAAVKAGSNRAAVVTENQDSDSCKWISSNGT